MSTKSKLASITIKHRGQPVAIWVQEVNDPWSFFRETINAELGADNWFRPWLYALEYHGFQESGQSIGNVHISIRIK